MRLLITSLHEHGLGHNRSTRARTGYHAALIVDLTYAFEDGCVADLAGDFYLVAAGEEHTGRIVQYLYLTGNCCFIARVYFQVVQMFDPERAKCLFVLLEQLFSAIRHRHSRHHELARTNPSRNLTQNDFVVRSVFFTTDND